MKVYKNTNYINAAIHTATHGGTTFYRLSIDDVIDALQKDDANVWIIRAFQELGWEALDLEHNLFGSRIIDGDLYLCVTDGYDIDFNGELYDPESILDDVDLDEISDYIQDSTKEIINKYITEYEIVKPKFNDWAKKLISDGVMFTDMVKDYHEFD